MDLSTRLRVLPLAVWPPPECLNQGKKQEESCNALMCLGSLAALLLNSMERIISIFWRERHHRIVVYFRQLWFVWKLNKRKRICKRSLNRLRFETCFCYFLALQDFRKVIYLSGPLYSSKKGTCNIGLERQLNKKKCLKYLVLLLQYTRCSLNCSYFFIQLIDRNSERTHHCVLNKRLACHVQQKVMGVRMQDHIYGWDASYNKTRQKPGN